MNPREAGFLLLTSCLGDPERKVLTMAQLRNLTLRARAASWTPEQRDLEARDIFALGFDRAFAERVIDLLSQEDQLRWYLRRAESWGCVPLTRISDAYPNRLRHCLNAEAPGTLWAKGDLSLLIRPMISLVGSRELEPENRMFAREAGRQAARQGFVLVSGNARGADREAQEACLEAGGSVISVVADSLEDKRDHRILYLSEEGYDREFSAQRALSRNRIIHCLGSKTLVAQCTMGKGGTWDGTTKNLRHGWSSVLCFDDGTEASAALAGMGACCVGMQDLANLTGPEEREIQENFYGFLVK